MRYVYYNDENFFYDCGIPSEIEDLKKKNDVLLDLDSIEKKKIPLSDEVLADIPKEMKFLNVN